MSEKIYSEVVPLLSSGDSKVRKFAVEKMIRHIDTLDRKDLLQYFGASVDDDDEEVSKCARYGMSILFQRDNKSKLNLSGEMKTISSTLMFDKDEMKQIRRGAEIVLQASIEVLKEIALNESDVEMGSYAVRILGRFAFPGTLETIYGATKLDDRAVIAVKALSRYSQEEALFLLGKFLSRTHDDDMRCVILTAISNFQMVEALEVLGKHCTNPDASVRACVARGLGKHKSEQSGALLIKLLDDDDVEVAGNAIDSLAIIGFSRAATRLLQFTEKGVDKRLRSRATSALGFIREDIVLDDLKKLLDCPDHRIVSNAIESLSVYDLQRTEIISLIGPLLGHPNNRVRGNAIKYMYSVEPGKAVRELQQMLQSPVRLDRATGAYLAGEIGTVDVVKWLVTLVGTERETTVLSASLNALERLERPEIKPALHRLFKHPNATIRAQAVRVFSKVADSSGMRILDELLSGEKVQTVRSAIISAMGNLGDSGNFMLLVKHLQDMNERVVANTIESLDRVGSLEITPFISPFLKNKINRIRANTIVTLWKLGDLKVAEDLQEMLKSGKQDQMRSAFHILKNISDFLDPALLSERPLLLSSLKDKYRLRGKKHDVSVTEITSEFDEIFRMEEQYENEAEQTDLSQFFKCRLVDDIEGMKHAMSAMFESDPSSAFAHYLSRQLRVHDEKHSKNENLAVDERLAAGGKSSTTGKPVTTGNSASGENSVTNGSIALLRDRWKEHAFLPGIFDLLETARKKKNLKQFLQEYLAIFDVQLKLYAELMARADNLLEAGETASVQRIVKFMVECVPVKASLHTELGDVAYDVREHDLAFHHLLIQFVENPDDCESALKLCSSALHCGEKDLAATVLDSILQTKGVDSNINEKAKRIKVLIAGR